MTSELYRIKQLACPYCRATRGNRCRPMHRDDVKIYPYRQGASEDEWVHPARRDLAIRRGFIRETPIAETGFIRSLLRRRKRK